MPAPQPQPSPSPKPQPEPSVPLPPNTFEIGSKATVTTTKGKKIEAGKVRFLDDEQDLGVVEVKDGELSWNLLYLI